MDEGGIENGQINSDSLLWTALKHKSDFCLIGRGTLLEMFQLSKNGVLPKGVQRVQENPPKFQLQLAADFSPKHLLLLR